MSILNNLKLCRIRRGLISRQTILIWKRYLNEAYRGKLDALSVKHTMNEFVEYEHHKLVETT